MERIVPIGVPRKPPLPLLMGEVAERSEDGEGIPGCNTLSVTFGDSSPKGGAKGRTRNGAYRYRYAPFPVAPFVLQIVRVLHRLFLRVPDQPRVAAKGVGHDLLFFRHVLTSMAIVCPSAAIMLHFPSGNDKL